MANVLTVDASYLGQQVMVLSPVQGQPIPAHVQPETVPPADTWATVLAAGNVSGGTNPTISNLDSLIFLGATAPAASGNQRVPADWSLVARNSADSGDQFLIERLTASNSSRFGDPSSLTTVRSSGTGLRLEVGGAIRVIVHTGDVQLLVPLMEFSSVQSAPTINQQVRSSGAGEQLTVQAQSTSAAASGGDLRLMAGTGGTVSGDTRILHPGGLDTAILVEGDETHTGGQAISVGPGGLAFFNGTRAMRPSVTGSRGGNAALASLLTELALMGLITDNTLP